MQLAWPSEKGRLRRNGMRRRREIGAIVNAAVGFLLMREIDPAHVAFEIGKEMGEGLFVARRRACRWAGRSRWNLPTRKHHDWRGGRARRRGG